MAVTTPISPSPLAAKTSRIVVRIWAAVGMAELSDFSRPAASGKFPTDCACKVGIFRLASDAMETELRSNLMACASAYAASRSVSMATIGRLAAGDWRFFDRLDDD